MVILLGLQLIVFEYFNFLIASDLVKVILFIFAKNLTK